MSLTSPRALPTSLSCLSFRVSDVASFHQLLNLETLDLSHNEIESLSGEFISELWLRALCNLGSDLCIFPLFSLASSVLSFASPRTPTRKQQHHQHRRNQSASKACRPQSSWKSNPELRRQSNEVEKAARPRPFSQFLVRSPSSCDFDLSQDPQSRSQPTGGAGTRIPTSSSQLTSLRQRSSHFARRVAGSSTSNSLRRLLLDPDHR